MVPMTTRHPNTRSLSAASKSPARAGIGSIMLTVIVPVLGAMLGGCYTPPEEPVALGDYVYEDRCAQCHGAEGHGNAAALVPNIAGLPTWYVERQLIGFRKGYRGAHPDDIAGMRMRPMANAILDEEDLSAVAGHVGTLTRAANAVTLDGDAAAGKNLFAACAACHGADGMGNEALNSPPLNGADDWYLLTQLKNFKHGVRGASEGDTMGAQMIGMANILKDEQAMKDVVAHIRTLK